MAAICAIIFILLSPGISSEEVHGNRMSAKVYGGNDASPGQFPFIGSLRNANDQHVCGATLIRSDTAVTAAHCFDLDPDETSDDLPSFVVFGDLQLSQTSPTHHQSTFTRRIHSQYDEDSNENDIALIYLENPVENFGTYISTIPLAVESFDYSSCKILGWGETRRSHHASEYLQFAPMELCSNQECKDDDELLPFFDATNLCARTAKADACKGDSGGPLACNRDDGTEVMDLVGVVSSGVEDCQANTPGIYTKVSAYQDWIASRSHPNCASMPFITLFFVLVMVYCY